MSSILERYNYLLKNDPTVSVIKDLINNDDAMKFVIVALVNQRTDLFSKVKELEAIAPKRIKSGGVIYRYDAPDELIPITSFDESFGK